MAWSIGSYTVMEVPGPGAVEDGQGNWFFVGHFIGLGSGQLKGAVLPRAAGPYQTEREALADGRDKAGNDALHVLTSGNWPP